MDLDFEFRCPECHPSVKATAAEIGRQVPKRCPNGHSIELVDTGGEARRMQRSADHLERDLGDFGR